MGASAKSAPTVRLVTMMWVNFIAAIRQRVSIAGRTIDSSVFSRPNFKWTHYQNFGSAFFPKRYACCRPKVWNIFPGHKHEKIPKTSVSADLKARNVLSSLNARHARGTVTFPSRCRSWWKRRLTCVASSTISSHFSPTVPPYLARMRLCRCFLLVLCCAPHSSQNDNSITRPVGMSFLCKRKKMSANI
jgi:hypothetical protein